MTSVLALHGFTGSPSELGFLVDRLREAGLEVSAPLLPGHGTSPEDLQDRTFEEWLAFARDALAAERKAHGRVIVVGFSMGTLLGLSLALESPGPDALVLLACALRMSPPLRAGFRLLSGAKRLPAVYVPKPFGPDLRDRTLLASIQAYDKQPLRAAMEVYRAGKRLRGELGRVKCPTLLLHGERDHVCDPAGSREALSSLGTTDVHLRTYARSAHMLALDYDRASVAHDVINFCKREERTGRHEDAKDFV